MTTPLRGGSATAPGSCASATTRSRGSAASRTWIRDNPETGLEEALPIAGGAGRSPCGAQRGRGGGGGGGGGGGDQLGRAGGEKEELTDPPGAPAGTVGSGGARSASGGWGTRGGGVRKGGRL